MKSGTIAAIILVALLAIGGIAYVLSGDSTDTLPASNVPTAQEPVTASDEINQDATQPEAQTFSSSEVATHNSEDDCWTIIDGSVYNITSYISRHPGGDEILRACGTDATTLFTQRTTEDGEEVGSGTPHSSSAANQLAQLKIGVLVN